MYIYIDIRQAQDTLGYDLSLNPDHRFFLLVSTENIERFYICLSYKYFLLSVQAILDSSSQR